MNYFIQSLLAGTIAFTNLTSVVEVNEKMKTGLISHTETQIEDVIYSNIYKQYSHTKINKTTDVFALNDIKIDYFSHFGFILIFAYLIYYL